jgi:hypothetical protein
MEESVRKLSIALGFIAVIGVAASVAQEQRPDAAAPAASPTAPVNACADLPEGQCVGIEGCVWLPGFKVANGTEVPGYCRPAPKPLTARRRPATEQPR